jgi:cell division protein FtsI (penicillin-binding protein 3)
MGTKEAGKAALATADSADARRERIAISVFGVLILCAFLGLGWRCYHLQYASADHYAQLSLRQQCAYLPLEPQRGAILDCRGRVLAASNQIRTVFADPRIIEDPKETANSLASVLDLPAHEICKMILDRAGTRYAPVAVGVEAEQAEAARAIEGIGIEYGWQRHYPMGPLASHVVGYTSVDNRGLGGIEYEFDRELRGEGARHVFFVDVHRRPLSFCVEQKSGDNGMPVNGDGIILTIDATIQQFVREELLKQYKAFEAEAALAVVADPRSGAILAMVSLPDFEPENSSRTDPNNFLNRVLTDQYEPGSIIKPFTASIALDTGAVNTHETIFCENGHYSGRGFGHIGEYRQGFGDLTLREIIQNSSNIGMAKIGQRVGAERLYEGLTLFGFGKKVGIDLPGEAEGLLRPPSEWTGYSVTRIPFGQEISVTAIQLLRALCMLANGGRLIRPHVIKAVVKPDGLVVDIRPPALRVGYIIKPEVAKWIVQDAMTAVVNDGTGKRAKLERWQVFGKTGTAQLAKKDGRGYEERAYVASFMGGAPAEDPRIVVLVSVRRPNYALRKGYTGGTIAAPVAGAIIERTLTYLEGPQKPTPSETVARAR